MQKFTLLFVSLILTAGLVFGAGGREPAPEQAVEPAVPQRIISMIPSNTEILYALGLDHAVVGVSNFCNYPPEMEKAVEQGDVQRIGDAFNVNQELIISLEPDLVLLGNPIPQFMEALDDLQIKNTVIAPATLKETIESFIRVGDLTGRPEEAGELAQSLENFLAALEAQTSQLGAEERPSVLMLLDFDYLFVAGTGTLEEELIYLAGGKNAVTAEGYAAVSEEAIIEADPDIIVSSFPYKERILQEKSSWAGMPAVENEAIYDIDGDLINRPGPRLSEGLIEFAELLHPGKFSY